MKRLVGYYNDVPVYEDPEAPPGVMYFLNDDWEDFRLDPDYAYGIKYTPWYRFKRFVKRSIMKR